MQRPTGFYEVPKSQASGTKRHARPSPARLPAPCRPRTVPPTGGTIPCRRQAARNRAARNRCPIGQPHQAAPLPAAPFPAPFRSAGTKTPQRPDTRTPQRPCEASFGASPPPPTPCRATARHQIPCLPSQTRIAPGPLPRRHSHRPGNCLTEYRSADGRAGKTPPQDRADNSRHQIPCQLLLAPYRAGNSQHCNRRLQ